VDPRQGNKDQFLHRRRMTWLAVVSGMLLYPLLVAFSPPASQAALSTLTIPYYGFLVTVAGAYFATSTIEHNNVRATGVAITRAEGGGEPNA